MELLQTIVAVSGLIPPLYFALTAVKFKRAFQERHECLIEYHRFLPNQYEEPVSLLWGSNRYRVESIVLDRSIGEPNLRGFNISLSNSLTTNTFPAGDSDEVILKGEAQADGTTIVDLRMVGSAMQTNFGKGDLLQFTDYPPEPL